MTETRSVRGKTVFVTGSTQRIGLAIAEYLGGAGANVIVHSGSTPDKAQLAAEILRKNGSVAAPVCGDLSTPEAAVAVFDAACEPFGVPDIVVNNASVFEPDEATAPDFGQFESHFALHVKAPVAIAARLAERTKHEALIVNMIDQRVLALNPRFFTYTLSKSALWTATRTMAQSYAPRIRVNAIGPGPTLANERQSQDDFDRQVGGLLLKRAPSLEEFGRTIEWMWSTPSVTGQLIALDGGQHLAWETPDIAGIAE